MELPIMKVVKNQAAMIMIMIMLSGMMMAITTAAIALLGLSSWSSRIPSTPSTIVQSTKIALMSRIQPSRSRGCW